MAKTSKPTRAAKTVKTAKPKPVPKKTRSVPVKQPDVRTIRRPRQTSQKKARQPRAVTPASRWQRFRRSVWPGRIYAGLALLTLLLTTVMWAATGARLHQFNADQLIDAYLFSDHNVFQQAQFPGPHTFLLKWPVFALMAAAGNTAAVFKLATIGLSLATVAGIAYCLWRIDRRPARFGLYALALACCLTVIPAQPAPGTLLPANFAMVTTRNIEYIVYLLAAGLVMRSGGWRGWRSISAVLVLGILIASDKLFWPLAVGAGGFLLAHALLTTRPVRRFKTTAQPGLRWLVTALAAMVIASGSIWALSASGITHIASQNVTSPYHLIGSVKQLAEALCYAVLAVFGNFGANPAHAELVLSRTPGAFLTGLKGLSGVSTLINLVIMGIALKAVISVLRRPTRARAEQFVILLAGTAIAALAVFVLTDHYYPSDARYVAIILVAGFAAWAVRGRQRSGSLWSVAVPTVLLLVGIAAGQITASREAVVAQVAQTDQTELQQATATIMRRERLHHLTGNYWQVLPIRDRSADRLSVWPLLDCTQPVPSLTSQAWLPKLHQPTAYLAIPDGPDERTYNGCRLSQIVNRFGIPTRRLQVNVPQGKTALLLVYDRGFRASAVRAKLAAPAVSLVQPVTSLRRDNTCADGLTLSIVAHEDDDILFLNPDLARDVRNGACMRTVFLTAGDAGHGAGYWLGRERGALSAYAELFGAPDRWRAEEALLQGNPVTVYHLREVPDVSLVFMHLPDGNLRGEGFAATGHQSLDQLLNGRLGVIDNLNGATSYTRDGLINSLAALIRTDEPSVVRTQGLYTGTLPADHSDHLAAGQAAEEAWRASGSTSPLERYAGYNGRGLPATLSDTELDQKTNLFLTYGRNDGAVCHSQAECFGGSAYGYYLNRQYSGTVEP